MVIETFKYLYILSIYMEMGQVKEQEQIIRTVSRVGNGAHIFAPKEWINERVLVLRIEKKEVKEEIINILYPYLGKIIGVYIYGSHARNEATENSDVDVLVIAKEGFKINKNNKFEFIVLKENEIEEAIKINPILMYSAFKEAKVIINEKCLDKWKREKVDKRLFKPFLKSTNDSIKSDEELLKLDRKTGKTVSNSVIYSLILRLRGIFIINCLVRNNRYSNKDFGKWIVSRTDIDYGKAYQVYQDVRNGKERKEEISIEQGEKLIELLKEEVERLKGLI